MVNKIRILVFKYKLMSLNLKYSNASGYSARATLDG